MLYPEELTAKTVSQILENIAAAYEIAGEDIFRIRAYQNAAAGVRHSGEDIRQIWQEGKLEDIPGIGASIAQHLDELFKTGRVKHFDQITRGFPEGFFELLKIPGVGPKTAYKLARKFHLTKPKTVAKELLRLAQKHEIQKLTRFGQESEQKILEGAQAYLGKKTERMVLVEAQNYADKIVAYLRQFPKCQEVETLGSLRRQAPTIGDVDIAVATDSTQDCLEWFVKYPGTKKVLAKGGNTARILLADNVQIDIKAVNSNEFGSLLQHFTGSKQHNILLREYALGKGYSLSEYGIKKIKDQRSKIKNTKQKAKIFSFKDEKSFYNFLGLQWIPPELREGTVEIEKAKTGKLPRLVKLEDIRGDLHVHSDIDIAPSHDIGQSSLEQLGEKARQLGYKYLGISDHNPKTSDLSEQKALALLKRRNEEIDKYNGSHENNVKYRAKKVFFFHSLEVDIKPDGTLALPEAAFGLFDFLIASVHSSFRLGKEQMTKRVLKALENPKIKILGHPSGRMLGKREGFEMDWDKIFDYCAKRKIFLEINAWPQRLDLPDHLVQEAINHDVKFVINTDSHAASQLSLMRFGVSVARRGWAGKQHIINTLSLSEIRRIITAS